MNTKAISFISHKMIYHYERLLFIMILELGEWEIDNIELHVEASNSEG